MQSSVGDALKVGDTAPEINLPASSGKNVKLSDYRGKNVVLYFYPKDDTTGCTKEACSFRDNMPNFSKLDAVVLGVSRDPMDSHHAFIQKNNLNFTLLSDTGLTAHQLYGVWKEREFNGQKSMGTERSTFVIDKNGRIKSIFRKVQVDGHEKQVLAAISS